MVILGIDPGRSGGVAVLSAANDTGRLRCEPSLFKLDQEENDLANLFWKIFYDTNRSGDWCAAVLEKVQVMPAIRRVRTPQGDVRQEVNAGIVSTATFMQSYGFLRGCLLTVGIPFINVRPQEWQKALGCMTRGDKNVSKRRAEELFPKLRVTHWNADALLLGEFGRRTHKSWAQQPAPAAAVGAGVQNGDVPFLM